MLRVREGRGAGQVVSPLGEALVECVHLAGKRGGGIFERLGLAQRQIASGPVGRNLARIDLVAQIAVDHPSHPDRRSERDFVRAAAGNAGDDPVGMGEIEARVEAERHDGRGGVRGALSGEHGHLAVAVHARSMIAGRERIDSVKVVAFDPVLQLAGLVAGVGAYFKHGDHDDLDLNGARLGGGRGAESYAKKQRK